MKNSAYLFADTHNHFMADAWSDGRMAEFAAAREAGVGQMIICAGGPDHFELTRSLAHYFQCGYALGLHPLFLKPSREAILPDLQALEEALEKYKGDKFLVAVGEIGLDGTEDCSCPLDIQEKALREQLKLARKHGLSVSLHGRKALDKVAKHIRELPVKGAFHAFSGSTAQAEKLVDLGLKLGFGGAITFSGSKRIRKVLSELPKDAWVLETDAPDMPGEQEWNRNPDDPKSRVCDIALYAEIAASLRNEIPEEAARCALENTFSAFPRLKTLGQMQILNIETDLTI